MVGEDGWFGAVSLHGHHDVTAVSVDTELLAGALTEAASAWELELDVLQFDIVHAVDGQQAGGRTENTIFSNISYISSH